MKAKLLIAVFALSSFAFAQRGGGRPAGAGGGMGGAGMGSTGSAGMGSTGRGTGMDSGPASHMGSTDAGRPSTTGRTPTQILDNNTKLSSNLDKLLPQGMTAQQACSGFKNLGQCVAAIHVSQNLDVPFADLKSKVTGDGSVSLGKAIGELKPSADVKAETKKAKQQAKQDMSGNS